MNVAEVLAWFAKTHPNAFGDSEAGKWRARIFGLFAKQFGGRLMEQCQPDELQAFIESHVVNPWTRLRWRNTLHLATNAAVVAGLITVNPVGPIRFPGGESRRSWTDDEFRALLRHAAPNMRRLILFARRSGARPSTIRSLRKSDVQGNRLGGIPLDAVLIKLVAWLVRNAPPDAEWLFGNVRGGPWSRFTLIQRFADIRKAAGLPDDVKLDGASPDHSHRQRAARPVKETPLDPGPGRTWTDAELRAILRQSKPALRRFLVFCRFSGLRPQEVRKLTWDALTVDDEGAMVAKIGRRSHRLAANGVTIKLMLWLGRKQRHRKGPWLFVKPCGGDWSRGTVHLAFLYARSKAGLPGSVTLSGCRPLA